MQKSIPNERPNTQAKVDGYVSGNDRKNKNGKIELGAFILLTDVTQGVTFCLNVIRYLKYPIFEQKTLRPAPYAF